MYEYKVIEAPAAGRRRWFGRSTNYPDVLSAAINELAADKWEYQRAECGLTQGTNLLVFRKPVARAVDEMPEPKRFSDRLIEAEAKAHAKSQSHREPGQDYAGPVRPRRARVLLDAAGTITERPATVDPHTIDLDPSAYEPHPGAERVTPYKPTSAAAAAS